MFNPSQDLIKIQQLIGTDAVTLSLLGLTEKPISDIIKRIIKQSRYNDLVTPEKRLCTYFVPSRKIKNESFYMDIIEIDCHIPASEDFKAWQIQEQIFKLLHEQKVNKRYLYFEGQLGELSTMPGFFCCGSRYKFYRNL